jgi:hypothetical protein
MSESEVLMAVVPIGPSFFFLFSGTTEAILKVAVAQIVSSDCINEFMQL